TALFTPANRLLARSWVGLGVRLVLDGRMVPLPWPVLRDRRRFLDHLGSYAALLDLPASSETSRYQFLHGAIEHLVRTTAFADIASAQRRYEESEKEPQAALLAEPAAEDGWAIVPLPPPVAEVRPTLPLIHY